LQQQITDFSNCFHTTPLHNFTTIVHQMSEETVSKVLELGKYSEKRMNQFLESIG
jgi:hypothetical protein